MTTKWTFPTLCSQYAEEGAENFHIPWDSSSFSSIRSNDSNSLGTMGTLEHSARSPKTDVTNKTYFLKITGFNFIQLPTSLSGIELRLIMNRGGRVTDETVSLCINDTLIGTNNADLDLNPLKVYGSETNLWDTNLTIADVTDPSFGVILRFKSHPHWPHRTGAFIDAVELRIH
jgi:hypothetical protein